MEDRRNRLKAVRIGINTGQEHIIFMREDCGICKSEGFSALSRIVVTKGGRSLVATINSVGDGFLAKGEASLSESAWQELGLKEGDFIALANLPLLETLGKVRGKLYGNPLSKSDFSGIISDITRGRLSNIQVSAFVAACVGERLSLDEIIFLTEAMIEAGERLSWDKEVVVDKHCVGGLPGNRITPIVVSIVAAAGLTIPKTSSRAITSPSGTADTMEVITNIDLSLEKMREVVAATNGCIAWGGAVNLSPADDLIIRVERSLDIDSEGQMIASVLSKKAAAGSTHVLLDIPVGPTAKVRREAAAFDMKRKLKAVGAAIGLSVKVVITDGRQPIGRGIGPALEARDVLAVMSNSKEAPADLLEKALFIAGEILELASACRRGEGVEKAREILASGRAAEKFFSICDAQGGFREPPLAKYTHDISSSNDGVVRAIDNRKLARVAKLAGAPHDQAAGLEIFAKIGSPVVKGKPLYTIHAESKGILDYTLTYVNSQNDIYTIER